MFNKTVPNGDTEVNSQRVKKKSSRISPKKLGKSVLETNKKDELHYIPSFEPRILWLV